MPSYTLLALSLVAVSVLLLLRLRLRLRYPRVLLLTFIVLMVAMLIFNSYLTSLPIVMYNRYSLLGIYINSFPLEDISYLVAAVLLLPALYNYFSNEK